MEHFFKFSVTLIAFAGSILAAKIISLHRSFSFLDNREERYGSIDGLRGFLAISVFFHHYIITWYWKNNGVWERPPEHYYQNYGKVGVAIFFMITGYLFASKVLKEGKGIDWLGLYRSRVLRIFPLYVFALIAMSIIVFSSSGFKMISSGREIANEYFNWIIFHGDMINGFKDTKNIIAGVDWTLKYEWIFYASLPFLALIIKRSMLGGNLLIIASCMVLFFKPILFASINTVITTEFFLLFAIGWLSACAYKKNRVQSSLIKSRATSSVVLLAIVAAIFYPDTMSFMHVLIISFFFILIFMGNDLFGVLSAKSTLLLGEISYSIYLLHGIVLYLVFSITDFSAHNYTVYSYLALMPAISIAIVVLSSFTFVLVEKPFIALGRRQAIVESKYQGSFNR